MIDICIVDDHLIVRSSLRHFLGGQVDMRVVGEGASAAEAVSLAATLKPGVMTLDLGLPGLGGMSVIEDILLQSPATRVLVLSGFSEKLYALAAMRMGAYGYIGKEASLPDILAAVRTVAMGGHYASAETKAAYKADRRTHMTGAPHERLSARELQVFLMMAKGMRLSRVAEELEISVKTASTYRGRVLEKMRMLENTEMTRYAMTHRLID